MGLSEFEGLKNLYTLKQQHAANAANAANAEKWVFTTHCVTQSVKPPECIKHEALLEPKLHDHLTFHCINNNNIL